MLVDTLINVPFYHSIGKEVEVFKHAYQNKIPFLLKGPTGTGKSRFVEYMAHQLDKKIITISCHEETSSTDLIVISDFFTLKVLFFVIIEKAPYPKTTIAKTAIARYFFLLLLRLMTVSILNSLVWINTILCQSFKKYK